MGYEHYLAEKENEVVELKILEQQTRQSLYQCKECPSLTAYRDLANTFEEMNRDFAQINKSMAGLRAVSLYRL